MGHVPAMNTGSMVQYLGENGVPVREVPLWAHEPELLLRAYEWMLLTRMFDQKAVALQRTGQLGTFPSSVGQEAIGVACGLALEEQDIFVPYYRDHATQLIRGLAMHDLLLYWGGDERGSHAGPHQDLPVCVPIASQCGHAVGAAAALKIRKQPQAVLCTLGDGATSKGDFLEALNLAGTWHLPVVFVINNNQWAISVPRAAQCGAPTLAQKGWGAGIHSVQVDGNDIIAMLDVVSDALERARHRKGPALIEAVSYRLGDHTTADDASRYRTEDEVNAAWEREPVLRLRQFLITQGAWSEAMDTRWQDHCHTLVGKAVEQYLATPPQAAEAMFDHLYAEWPAALDEQLDLFAARMTAREV